MELLPQLPGRPIFGAGVVFHDTARCLDSVIDQNECLIDHIWLNMPYLMSNVLRFPKNARFQICNKSSASTEILIVTCFQLKVLIVLCHVLLQLVDLV